MRQTEQDRRSVKIIIVYGMCVFVVPNAKAPVIVIKIYREKKVQQEKKSEGKERINKYKI